METKRIANLIACFQLKKKKKQRQDHQIYKKQRQKKKKKKRLPRLRNLAAIQRFPAANADPALVVYGQGYGQMTFVGNSRYGCWSGRQSLCSRLVRQG